jgi:hypothetical protein
MEGTYEIVPSERDLQRAFAAMLKGKSFRLRKSEKQAWKESINREFSSTWWTIEAINADGTIKVCGNMHDVLEDICLDSLIGV